MNSFANDGKDSLQEEDGLVSIHLVVAAVTIEHFASALGITSWWNFL